MLKGIDHRLGADVLHALRAMGHGDTIILCDTNFPAQSTAQATILGRLLSMENLSAPRAARAVLSVMPLDTFVDDFAARMEVVGDGDALPEVQIEVQHEIDRAEGAPRPMVSVERFAFYDMARQAYGIIQTGETRFYGCFMLRKGVIDPSRCGPVSRDIVILGVFVADASFRADRQPVMGETILGNRFALGPGGKGSNQAVAAARAGGAVHFITRLGKDTFGDMALNLWREVGVTPAITRHADGYTGAAYIFLEEATGDNAIIVCPGVAGAITPEDLHAQSALIAQAGVFMTQLETPIEAARAGLTIARTAGVTTILNPAPAADLDDGLLGLCDWITPNESEAEGLTGVEVRSAEDAGQAADALIARGVGAAIITLGAQGVLLCQNGAKTLIPAMAPGPVIETTGAGDAFNGGFAAALARGEDPITAARFGCAVAGLSVTRAGAAASMPSLADVQAMLA